MKKFLTIILVVIMSLSALAFTACDTPSTEAPGGGTENGGTVNEGGGGSSSGGGAGNGGSSSGGAGNGGSSSSGGTENGGGSSGSSSSGGGTQNGGGSSTVAVYTVTKEKWEETFTIEALDNVKITANSEEGTQGVFEFSEDKVREVTFKEQSHYDETIIVKVGDIYKYYEREDKNDKFTVKTVDNSRFESLAREVYNLIDAVKGIKSKFNSATYSEIDKCYTLSLTMYEQEVNFTVAFENGKINKLNMMLYFDYSGNIIYEFAFGSANITIPSDDMIA